MTDRLAARIQHARYHADMNQSDLADAIGRKQSTIASYETGKVEPPLSVLRAIADATNTTLIDLLGIRLSPAQLLRLLADHNAQLVPLADARSGEPLPTVLVGISLNQEND